MILYELCQKDVIDLHTGKNLGTVDDIAFDETSAIITHLVIYGKWKLFGLLGRHPDTKIPWKAIRTIGKDAVLSSFEKETQRRSASVSAVPSTIAGQALFVTTLVILFTTYIRLFRKDYLDKPRSIAMLYAMITVFPVLVSLMMTHNVLSVYILPTNLFYLP